MTDLDRLTELDEALDSWGPFDPAHPVDDGLKQKQRMLIADFAQAYRDLLANPAEPDYEAAVRRGIQVTGDIDGISMGDWRSIVDVAVAGRLLVGKPKPKTCKHGHTTMHDDGEFACAGPIGERVEKP